jgi:hypothetical protein
MRPPWRDEASPDLAGVPTMISAEERTYLHWLARCAWRDAGHVLEVGPWLGGSTLCLAAGMRARGAAARHRLHAVDNFLWRPFMEERAALGLRPGQSFEARFRANLAGYADLVTVHAASLPDEPIPDDPEAAAQRDGAGGERPLFAWDARERIEILFIDGAKSWRGMRHLLLAVGASLQPETLLVCQDFKYWGCYWVPMILGLLSDALEIAHVVRAGDTVSFRLRAPLAPAALAALPADVLASDPEQALAALEWMRRTLRDAGDALGAHTLALSRVKFLAHRGDLDAACRAFERSQAGWPLFARPGQLERARRYLRATRGRAVPERHALALAARARRLFARLRRAKSRASSLSTPLGFASLRARFARLQRARKA